MSDIARRARTIAANLLPQHQGDAHASLPLIEAALSSIRSLHALDPDDEVALAEAAETLMTLRTTLS